MTTKESKYLQYVVEKAWLKNVVSLDHPIVFSKIYNGSIHPKIKATERAINGFSNEAKHSLENLTSDISENLKNLSEVKYEMSDLNNARKKVEHNVRDFGSKFYVLKEKLKEDERFLKEYQVLIGLLDVWSEENAKLNQEVKVFSDMYNKKMNNIKSVSYERQLE